MLKIYFDCETTGINPYNNEIIEAYFKLYDDDKFVDDYLLQSKVNFWEREAELIHQISYFSMGAFPDKSDAFRQLLDWLPERFRFINYANKNTQLGTINFDVAILENELDLLGYPRYHLKNTFKMKSPESIHQFAKDCAKKGYYKPVKGESGRASYSQSNVYKALFDDEYNAHDAKSDVNALVKIHKKLLSFEGETLPLFREY